MNNPLNTIFTPVNRTKFKKILETQTRPFPNNKINRIQARYQTVFSRIMDIFSKSIFYNNEFLPRMNQRKKFMKINNKILGKNVKPLKKEEFEEQKKKLQISNTYDEYSSRQDIPLFIYITNDPNQFENWSAIRIFEWWRSLRMSGIPKREWNVLEAVKYLFINQFMRIMNSYLKYGVHKRDEFAFIKLQEYLRLVDVFYENRGQYQYLLDAHLAFCEWFSARFIGGLLFESGRNNDKKYVNSGRYYNNKYIDILDDTKKKIIEYFNRTCKDDTFVLVIPLSFIQKESSFINTYSAPFIVFLGINYRTHYENTDFNELYSPYGQIYHDFVHAENLINHYDLLYTNDENNISDILLFETRCKFLTLLSSIHNDETKKLLWFILHEKTRYFFSNNTQFDLTKFDFFNISKLFMKLNLIQVVRNYPINSIHTLMWACIIFFMSNFLPLEYFKDLQIEIESFVFTKNENNISNKLIKILRKEKLLIEFEYDVKTKQLKLLFLSDSILLKGILELQSKGVLIVHNPYCFESYLLSPNTIQACKILSGYAFFNNVFLPKMRERVAKNREIMRVNKKFSKLLEQNFQTKHSELGMKTNTFNKYQERYDTQLFTYIYGDKDQFENWSAIRIFEWWRNLRMSGTQFSTFREKIPKRKWPVFDAFKYLFINQILHILNSYRKYGITDERHRAFDELQQYLQLVDVFYENEGQYQYLLDAHLAYCRWFSARFIGGLLFETGIKNIYSNTSTYVLSKNDELIESIRKLFNYTLEDTNSILFAILSYLQKESKFINTYSAPLIVFLGVNYRTHIDYNNFKSVYSPEGQLFHDIIIHYSRMIIKSSYNNIKINAYNDVMLFAKRCKFLMIVSLIKDDNVSILLWYILHERSDFYFTKLNFFNIDILLDKLLTTMFNLIDMDTINNRSLKQILKNGINKLICVCIIFFICQYLLLNEIKQIRINIITDNFNDDTIKIFFFEEMIIEFKIIYDNQQISINHMIPNIDRRYIEGLNYIEKYFRINIPNPIQLEINKFTKTKQLSKNMYKKIGNIYTKIGQLQQSQPN